jgi:Ca2+-binding EF-hand superfamily protein
MKQIGLSLRKEELEILFNHFDVDGSGSIDFEEFMSGVRDSLSDHRLDLVEKCYEFLDNEGYGSIDADVLTRKYDYKNHPDVLDGKVKALDIYNDFLNSFDTNAEGTVTRTEFVNYYTNLVAGVGNKWNDAYFERLLRNTWNIPSDFLSDSTVDVYDTIARQTQFSLEPDKHRPAKTSIKHIRDHSNHSLLYHNNFGEQHGSYKLNLAQSKRQPSQEWNKSSLQLGAPNLAPTTTPTKHLSDFARKAEIARTPVAQRQSGNNSFRSQFTLG